MPDLSAIETNARRIVSTLARDYPSRHGTMPALLESAARYVEDEFGRVGYSVNSLYYASDQAEVRNLVVEKKGTDPLKPVLIVGAHYDTVLGTDRKSVV